MSLPRIPLTQVFRTKSNSNSTSSSSRSASPTSPIRADTIDGSVTAQVYTADTTPLFTSPTRITAPSRFDMAQVNGRSMMGTKTPLMLEYERQSEERQREFERMREEKDRMMEAEAKMAQEQERIAQEEYEMRQYYEAQALKHAEEKRAHQEEVKKHQQRVRDHERRLKDHEASAEAFARLIAMPASPARGGTAPILPIPTKNGRPMNGSPKAQAPAQFPVNGV